MSSLHPWLDDTQKALMHSATSTASEFGHIGLCSIEGSWKRKVQEMVGSSVAPDNYLRAFNVTGRCRHGPWKDRLEVRTLLRLTPNQATIMKMRHGGSGDAWVKRDPTGECWGNMLIAQHSRKHYKDEWANAKYLHQVRGQSIALHDFIRGMDFGPTQKNVSVLHYAGLPEHAVAPFIMWNWGCVNDFNTEVDMAPKPAMRRWVDAHGEEHREMLEAQMELFETPRRCRGQDYAIRFSKSIVLDDMRDWATM